MKSETKKCQNCEQDFVIEPDDFGFYEKIHVPPPTWCPECRCIRRMSFRNAYVVYKRKVENSDVPVFSSFHPDSPFTVYEQSYWWSGDWDPMVHGQPYNFSRPFFTQLRELMQKIPWPAGYSVRSINSEFCNNVNDLKNCYLLFNSGFSESCAYGIEILRSSEVFDSTKVVGCELSKELLDCEKCNRVFFSQDCVKCSEVFFSQNLVGCHNCFGCINLRHKQYCIFNKQHTKEEYKEFFSKLDLGSYNIIQETEEKSKKHFLEFPRKYTHGQNNNNVSGDYLDHSKNTRHSFLCREMENCKYCQLILFLPSRDSYDITVAGGEMCYEVEEGGGFGIKFSWLALPKNLKTRQINLSDMEYSMECFNSSYLFGCVGLKNKQYCILNKQYTTSEYIELVPRVIEHMNEMPYVDAKGRVYKYGEFFPPELSPFYYNETIAQEYYPKTKEEVLSSGFKWREKEKRDYKIEIAPGDLPDRIKNTPDDIVGKIIGCLHRGECNEQCTEAFKIIESELAFLKRMNLALPRLCPNCRHFARLKKRNPLKLWHRQCMCGSAGSPQATGNHEHKGQCPNEFETSYAPERPEIVYCERCYQQEVY